MRYRWLISFIIAFSITHLIVSSKSCNCNKETLFPVMEEIWEHPIENLSKPPLGEPPSYFSWTDYGGEDWTTPARYQGMCGSCWDFAAVAALESVINIKENLADLDPDLSEQYVLSCLPLAGSCKGGHPYWAYYYIKSTSPDGNYYNGIVTEECFPYEADDSISCDKKCNNWLDNLVPIKDFGYWFPDGSEEDRNRIKMQIMEKGPVVTFMAATQDFMEWGLYNHNPDDYYPYEFSNAINHCVIIVGWKDDESIPHGGYWICKNSWGKYWGYNGFFNIEYGSLSIDRFEIVWVDYDASQFNWPPVANAGKEYFGKIGEEIEFDGSESKDDEGNIVSWHWEFGDGSIGEGMKVKHSYENRGIYSVTLTVKDPSGKEGMDIVPAFIDVWKKGEKWSYDVKNIDVEMEGIEAHLNINNLKFKVKEESYSLKFNGILRGDFVYSLYGIEGKLLFAILNGNMEISKNFSIEKINLNSCGLMLAKTTYFDFPIPIPFRIVASIELEPSFKLIDFPLEVGKAWSTSLSKATLNGYVTPLFGIIKMPFEFEIMLATMEGNCINRKTINVEAGSFEAYEISFYDLIKIYYSPDVANIIKLEVDYEGMTINAELKETNYGE